MKKTVAKIALSLVFALATHAQAMSPIATPPLVKLWIGGGMPGPGGLDVRTITVSVEGNVIVFERMHPNFFEPGSTATERTFTLPDLSDADLHSVTAAASSITGGTLVGPDEPMCSDVPGTRVSIFKKGQEIPVFERHGCLDHVFEDQAQAEAAEIIVDLLVRLDRSSDRN